MYQRNKITNTPKKHKELFGTQRTNFSGLLLVLNVTQHGWCTSLHPSPLMRWGVQRRAWGKKIQVKGKCSLCDCFNIGFLEYGGTVESLSSVPAQRSPGHTAGNGEGFLPSTSFHQERTTWVCAALLWPLGPAHQG